MGINYYWIPRSACDYCERKYPKVHIGKSSYGWHFSLHIFGKDELHEDVKPFFAHDIECLDDWQEVWSPLTRNKGGIIIDEDEEIITPSRMIHIITKRKGDNQRLKDDYIGNNAELGLNNLLRHKIDDISCVGHGSGTWDYIRGNFC